MKRYLVATVLALVAAVMTSDTASAQLPGPYGFIPYGFYQPYGAHYGNSIRTPPYFATNPPVYYGARHARPYGLSPFASPPLMVARDDYRSRLRSRFSHPSVPTPEPLANPYITPSKKAPAKKAAKAKETEVGAIRLNPFVSDIDRIVKR